MHKSLALLAVTAFAVAAVVSVDAERGAVPQSGDAAAETVAAAPQPVTEEQAAAMLAGRCRVQCPGDPNARSAVSCRHTTASECRQIAASNANCRADYIPAMWCATRTLAEN